ncbi:transposase [Rhodopirellula baltica WH47]|uniref:Transposase n=1 Tax=Rhodopirellula baltica WH47 TaxID=991778 RepID=F2AM41_RHOBT|nr:transposase [Rhodopirellula baltica WH47]
MRAISQASELTKVRDKLGNEKASLGSLSEAGGLFSADLLKPVIEALSAEVNDSAPAPRLSSIQQTITAVDGSR